MQPILKHSGWSSSTLRLIGLTITVAIAIFLRFWNLDALQKEVFGDISEGLTILSWIRDGQRPWRFVLGDGPLFFYLSYPVSLLFGFNYLTLKVTSALVGLTTIAFTYGLARELINRDFALIAAFVASVSSWLLIFTRMGNIQPSVTLTAMGGLWLLAIHVRSGRIFPLVISGALGAAGWYTYPAGFAIPFTLFASLLATLVIKRKFDLEALKAVVVYLATLIVFSLPMILIVQADPALFAGGYIGDKARSSALSSSLIDSTLTTFLATHVRGDGGYRGNIVNSPHLDPLSGILMMLGLAFWVWRFKNPTTMLLFVPWVMLQLPSIIAVQARTDVPSTGRTLGAAPIICIFVAGGLWLVLKGIQRVSVRRTLPVIVLVTILGTMLGLNWQRYFVQYMNGLPYGNTSVTDQVLRFADALPNNARLVLVTGSWVDSMPNPRAIQLLTQRPNSIVFEPQASKISCDYLAKLPPQSVLVWDFKLDLPNSSLETCRETLNPITVGSETGYPGFRMSALQTSVSQTLTLWTKPESRMVIPTPPNSARITSQRQAGPAGVRTPGSDQFSNISVRGSNWAITHSTFDQGTLENVFDGNLNTLARGESANPFVFQIKPSKPITSVALEIKTASLINTLVTAYVTFDSGRTLTFTRDFLDAVQDPTIRFDFPPDAPLVEKLRLELFDRRQPPNEGFHMHIYELSLR